ncbi:MAG: biopolymer transporter ExbD [Pseudomonadota bacterium]|nr:MAG: biopolymer transporter ExbD [Pseudomonadota bacterium]
MARLTRPIIVVPGKRPGKRLMRSRVFGRGIGKGQRDVNSDLNLVPMIDIFVLLVIFLIQQFSADGDLLFMTDRIKMPEAANYDQLMRAPVIQISPDDIALEGQMIARISDIEGQELWNIPKLEEVLRDQKKAFETLNTSQEFKGDINIQADVNVPFKVLKKVMYSANQAGYFNINFAVIAAGGGAPSEETEG